MLQLMPEETLTILSSASSTSSALLFACPFAPFTFKSPSTNTLPSAFTKVIQSLAQEACLTFCRSILTGALLFSFFYDSLVPIVLNLSFFCSKPHTQASPFSVMTHICWYPQLTCTIFSLNSTSLGMRTLRLGGLWPSSPFLFLPQVSSFPSRVMPADNDFLESMSTKLTFLIIWGSEKLDSDPRPSSPFLPKPQDHTFPSFFCEAMKERGKRQAAPRASEAIILLRFIRMDMIISALNQNQHIATNSHKNSNAIRRTSELTLADTTMQQIAVVL